MSESARTLMLDRTQAAEVLGMSELKFHSLVASGVAPKPRLLGKTLHRWLSSEIQDFAISSKGAYAQQQVTTTNDQKKVERTEARRKSHVARTKRRADEEALRKEALIYAGGLKQQIETLERQLSELQRVEALSAASATLTGHTLLREHEISACAEPWGEASGVYFLLDYDRVVYVGQSINVHNRISSHSDKVFNRYAYIPCPPDRLNVLESLYIHCLRPPLNASTLDGGKVAPVSLYGILGSDVVEIQNAKATPKGKRK